MSQSHKNKLEPDEQDLANKMSDVYKSLAAKYEGAVLLINAYRDGEVEGNPFYDVHVDWGKTDHSSMRAVCLNVIEFFWEYDKKAWDEAMIQFAREKGMVETLPDGREVAILHRKGEHK